MIIATTEEEARYLEKEGWTFVRKTALGWLYKW